MVEMSAAVEHTIHKEKLQAYDKEHRLLKDEKTPLAEIKIDVDREETKSAKDVDLSANDQPTIQYSREELLILEKADLAILRPNFLNPEFDRDGRWDPMAWHGGKALTEAESAPVGTLEFRKRARSNAADTKDVDVVLSPQRMSFGSGCAGSKVVPNSDVKRQNGLLKSNKFDKNSERTRDPEREKHLQKINGNYSGNREQIRKAIRDLHENRERNKDGKEDAPEGENWVRGEAPPSVPPHYEKFTDNFKSDYRPPNTKYSNNKRQWNPRRYSEKSVEDEPEWFSAGPTSRLDTIELKGFEDDDKLHSNEADTSKEDTGGRVEELAMDPLGNPDMTSASNQYVNDSMYSTGLQEDWDPTNPKFNIEGLLDPHAFLEEGKDLLEAEKSMTGPSSANRLIDFWGNAASSPKEYPSPVTRPVGSPAGESGTSKENVVPFSTSEVHFGENVATSSLKTLLGVHEPKFGAEAAKLGMNGPVGPSSAPPFFDMRNGPRPPLNMDDPIVRQLLHNDRSGMKPPGDIQHLMRPDMLQNPNIPRNIREMLLQRSQSEMLSSTGGMLPHPGPVQPPRLPGPDQLFRDPRLTDHRVVDPRLVDPRFMKPEFGLPSPSAPHVKPSPSGHPRSGQELLNAVKNDPAQLDKVINVLQTTLKLGQAPPDSQPAMTALLRDMEKAKSDNIKLQTLQILAGTHPQSLGKPPGDQIHDKTQALKALLRLPGQGPPLMTAPARMAPAPTPHHHMDMMRPRNPGEEGIPTRITHHHDTRNMMGNKPGFPMAFTPTSVMIKSSEIRNMIKSEELDQHHIQLTPSHMQPQPHTQMNHRFQQQRSSEMPGYPMNGKKSPRYDEGLRPVPTIETSRNNVPKLHFPSAPNFSPHHQMPMKGMPPALMMQQIAKGMPPHSPHGGMPSQMIMQELMHSNKPPNFPPHLQAHQAANGMPR